MDTEDPNNFQWNEIPPDFDDNQRSKHISVDDMKNKCKQKRYVCCHCEKDVNKLTKQDQDMLDFKKIKSDAIQKLDHKYVGTNDPNSLDMIGDFIYWMNQLIEESLKQTTKARKDTAQECYLECLASECGEGECATAIKTKFKLEEE